MAGPEFKHSTALFKAADGRPIKFYCLPGETKALIHPMIKHGGGMLTSRGREEDTIKLATEGQVVREDAIYSYKYILDCVEKNTLLPLEQYKVKNMKPSVSSSKTSMTVTTSEKGRQPFLKSEQIAILKYVAENQGRNRPVGGNKIWKEMELYKVTKHSWHAMRDHFLKYLKGKEHLFDMDERMKYPNLEFGKDKNQTSEEKDSPKEASDLHSDENLNDSSNIDMFDSSAEEQNATAELHKDTAIVSCETMETEPPCDSNMDQGPTQASPPVRSPRVGQLGGGMVSQVEGDSIIGPDKRDLAGPGIQEDLSPGVRSIHSASSDDLDRHLTVIAVELDKSHGDAPTSTHAGTTTSSPKKPLAGERLEQDVTVQEVNQEDATVHQITVRKIPAKRAAQTEQVEEVLEKRGRLKGDVDSNAPQDGKVQGGGRQENQEVSCETAQGENQERTTGNVLQEDDTTMEEDRRRENSAAPQDGRQARAAQYVMESQDTDGLSQGENQGNEEDEDHLMKVLEGCVKIKELMTEFDLSLLMATRALYYNCGQLDATKQFLRTGRRPDDLPTRGWSMANSSHGKNS